MSEVGEKYLLKKNKIKQFIVLIHVSNHQKYFENAGKKS